MQCDWVAHATMCILPMCETMQMTTGMCNHFPSVRLYRLLFGSQSMIFYCSFLQGGRRRRQGCCKRPGHQQTTNRTAESHRRRGRQRRAACGHTRLAVVGHNRAQLPVGMRFCAATAVPEEHQTLMMGLCRCVNNREFRSSSCLPSHQQAG